MMLGEKVFDVLLERGPVAGSDVRPRTRESDESVQVQPVRASRVLRQLPNAPAMLNEVFAGFHDPHATPSTVTFVWREST